MDDASYAVLAQSIVFSDTYGLVNVPGQPQPTRYPFGFPLILSPFAAIFPQKPEMMKVVSLLATLLNVALLFLGWPFLSRNGSHWWGLTIAALYSTSPLVIGHTRMVMSEPIFTTFVLVALVLAEKCLADGEGKPLLGGILLGAVAFFALFVRTVGITLVIAILLRVLMLSLSWSSKVRRLIWFFLCGVIFIGVIVAITPVAIESLLPIEYTDQFDNPQEWGQSHIEDPLIPRLFGAFLDYTKQCLREAVIPIGGGNRELEFGRRLGVPDLPLLTGLAIAGGVLWGSVSVFQGQGLSPTTFIFTLLYFGVILLWPWRGARFLYPIQPFLFYCFLKGVGSVVAQLSKVKWVSSDASNRASHLSVVAFFVLLLFVSFYKGTTDNENSLQYVRNLQVGATWLRNNSPAEALVMTQQPQGIYLYSYRKTIDYVHVSTVSELEEVAVEYGVDYILIAPELKWREDGHLEYDVYTREKFLPLVDELVARGMLILVYQSDEDRVQVYQVAD